MRKVILLFIGLAVVACGPPTENEGSAEQAQETPSTFNLSPEEFVAAFNRESAENRSQIADCENDEKSGVMACRVNILDMPMRQKMMRDVGLDVPGMTEYNGEYVTLGMLNGKVSRIMIAGDRRVFGAMMMTNTLTDAVKAIGGDVARAELADEVAFATFDEAAGLSREPPPFGTQVAFSRPYAEIACTLATSEPLVYACYLTPPGTKLDLQVQ